MCSVHWGHFRPNGLQDADQYQKPIYNHIYLPINVYKGVNFFEPRFSQNEVFQLSNFKMIQPAVELSFWNDFFFQMLVLTSTVGYYWYLEIDFTHFVYDFSDRIINLQKFLQIVPKTWLKFAKSLLKQFSKFSASFKDVHWTCFKFLKQFCNFQSVHFFWKLYQISFEPSSFKIYPGTLPQNFLKFINFPHDFHTFA